MGRSPAVMIPKPQHAVTMRWRRILFKFPPPSRDAGSRATDFVPSALAERLLTVGEVAHMLRVSRNTVYYLIRCGELPSICVKNMQRLRGRDVSRYVQRHYARKSRKRV